MSIGAVSWESAELPVLDEPEMAEWHRACGLHLVEHRGRYWVQLKPGFFGPVHHLARLQFDEATRPTRWCLSFRARLVEAHAAAATGVLALHLMPQVHQYELARLPSRRRQEIRRALREIDVVALRTPDLLLDQGDRIMGEACARNPHIPRIANFRRELTTILDPPRGLVLAALRGGRLLGFATGYAVEGAVYHNEVYVGDDGLPYHVSLALFHALATLAARQGSLRELMHGFYIPTQSGLSEFKRRIGLTVVHVPVKSWIAPGLSALGRRLQPEKYDRWMGCAALPSRETAASLQ